MLASILLNYLTGRLISTNRRHTLFFLTPKIILTIGVTLNLILLISFKYANFITDNFNLLLNKLSLQAIDLAPIHLPLGISFFTFQAISYIVDVYRKEAVAQKNIFDLALYIALFPQLIAGPIVRYVSVSDQISKRNHSLSQFSSGVDRFIIGLSKKLLLANPIGETADNIFSLTTNELTAPIAWIGIVSYTLQIYFDFSGYSDMAIGLGRMFGFNFMENFNYPYIATSLRDFWRRWHISLSTWFRDYVFIPLGGSRVGIGRVYANLSIVFLLTGIWHGASWNFVIWGLIHGCLLILERLGKDTVLKNTWQPIKHVYVLFVVMLSWVFFRSDDLSLATNYCGVLLGFGEWQTSQFQLFRVLTAESAYVFIPACFLTLPLSSWIPTQLRRHHALDRMKAPVVVAITRSLALSIMFGLCLIKIASISYNPFIYFRF